MVIRLINKDDSRLAISHVYESSWKNAYKGIIPQTYLDGIPEGRWVQVIDDPAWHTLIMLDGEKIIGTTSYCKSRFEDMNGYGEIISVYILPEYCGKGYGKQLLQAAVDGLIRMEYRDIFLWVLENNANARRFYESFGFVASGAYSDDEIGGEKVRELQYIYHV